MPAPPVSCGGPAPRAMRGALRPSGVGAGLAARPAPPAAARRGAMQGGGLRGVGVRPQSHGRGTGPGRAAGCRRGRGPERARCVIRNAVPPCRHAPRRPRVRARAPPGVSAVASRRRVSVPHARANPAPNSPLPVGPPTGGAGGGRPARGAPGTRVRPEDGARPHGAMHGRRHTNQAVPVPPRVLLGREHVRPERAGHQLSDALPQHARRGGEPAPQEHRYRRVPHTCRNTHGVVERLRRFGGPAPGRPAPHPGRVRHGGPVQHGRRGTAQARPQEDAARSREQVHRVCHQHALGGRDRIRRQVGE